jgi:hypothetical protein
MAVEEDDLNQHDLDSWGKLTESPAIPEMTDDAWQDAQKRKEYEKKKSQKEFEQDGLERAEKKKAREKEQSKTLEQKEREIARIATQERKLKQKAEQEEKEKKQKLIDEARIAYLYQKFPHLGRWNPARGDYDKPSEESFVNIFDLDKKDVLFAAWKHAKPTCLTSLDADPDHIRLVSVMARLNGCDLSNSYYHPDSSSDWNFVFHAGRRLNLDLRSHRVSSEAYDRLYGFGAFESIIKILRRDAEKRPD